jgi:two-component system, NarL family, nitrate/nitrite response regulator NarL
MNEQIRIAIVDDHALMRTGIVQTLEELGGFTIVGEGASADDARRIASEDVPEIMLVDINMPGDGLVALQDIVAQHLPVKVVMLTVFDSLSNVQKAMSTGAAGFVPKGVEGAELARILRDIHGGRQHVDPVLAARLFSQGSQEQPSDPRLRVLLSERETQIHALIGKGLSNAEIATRLGLKATSVKQYSSILFQKLGVKNRTEAALLLK